jgi:predicted aminopeptidase
VKAFESAFFSWIPVLSSAFILALVFFLCSGCYTLKQGTTMLGYLGKAVPLEELSAEDAPAADRAFAERVADIRRFAIEELGLKESKNYTRYVAIDRDYLAAVVSACAADSFTRRQWRFPVVGDVPYKGFFNPDDAKKEAAKLEAEGLDVWVRGVDAFSTLGWFRDPLYSYMKDYSDYELANLIIHELLHATVFIKGQAEFNERLAEFVGGAGARLYIENKYGAGSTEYAAIGEREERGKAFTSSIRDLRTRLEAVYNDAGLGREEKLSRKEVLIAAAKKDIPSIAELPVNNAYIDLFTLYYDADNFLPGLYAGLNGEGAAKLRSFVTAAESLNKNKAARKDPKTELEKAVKSPFGII